MDATEQELANREGAEGDDGAQGSDADPEAAAGSNPVPLESDSTATVSAGDQAPSGTLLAEDGSAFELSDAFRDQPAVLVFYRGHWCTFCRQQLEEIETRRSEFDDRNLALLGIVVDPPAANAGLSEQLGLSFPLYADPELELIGAWDLIEEGVGISVPATILVREGGEVMFLYVGENLADRPLVDLVLDAFDALN